MWANMETWEKWFAIIVVMGSFVDILQFSWIIKRGYFNLRERIRDNMRKDILLEEYKGKKFPGISMKDLPEIPRRNK